MTASGTVSGLPCGDADAGKAAMKSDAIARRAQMRIGQSILMHLDVKLPARTVGKMMGISTSLVERTEKLAGYKILCRLKEQMNYEQ